MPEWIEDELARHLKPVKAPDTLWNRVSTGQHSSRPKQRSEFRWILWPAVAGLLLLASSEVRYHAQRPTITPTYTRTVSAKITRDACVQCHTDRL